MLAVVKQDSYLGVLSDSRCWTDNKVLEGEIVLVVTEESDDYVVVTSAGLVGWLICRFLVFL